MPTARLLFLYPQLARSVRASEQRVFSAQRVHDVARRSIITTPPRDQQFTRRHGKAVQPLPLPSDKKVANKLPSKKLGQLHPHPVKSIKHASNGDAAAKTATASSVGTEPVTSAPNENNDTKTTEGKEEGPIEGEAPKIANPAVETLLQMEPPSSESSSKSNLHPPPYVHHFDSYTMVKHVEKGGFTEQQSIITMKAIRGLLSHNLETAKEELVSQSDVENEKYLFEAACSELQTEVQNNRKANDERMRRERTLLQHEADILSQKMTQELSSLKDDLRGMFNDRRMSVREEQGNAEKALQELNYKITVALNSDSKSEVEGLRWVLTRRAVIALVFSALMILSFLRYVTYTSHEQEEERKRRERVSKASTLEQEFLRQQERERIEGEDLSATGAAEILSAS